MMYIATLHAFDAMTTVSMTVHVRAYPDTPEDRSSIVFECTTAVPGIGESDPAQWLRDVLVAMLEAV